MGRSFLDLVEAGVVVLVLFGFSFGFGFRCGLLLFVFLEGLEVSLPANRGALPEDEVEASTATLGAAGCPFWG